MTFALLYSLSYPMTFALLYSLSYPMTFALLYSLSYPITLALPVPFVLAPKTYALANPFLYSITFALLLQCLLSSTGHPPDALVTATQIKNAPTFLYFIYY
jgi:hypothetical protein